MSNSSLATITKISPNKTSPRTSKIDTITIHHTAGIMTAQSIADEFYPTNRKGSCNYGVGSDGLISLVVDECDRSWCSSSSSNDHRAITIEVSNDSVGEPYSGKGWTVSEKTYNALIDLCVDICRRNGINELKWENDSSLVGQPEKCNLTLHQWFVATACPGDYLISKMGDIASEVNALLTDDDTEEQEQTTDTLYRVQVGAFKVRDNADAMLKLIKASGFDGFVYIEGK